MVLKKPRHLLIVLGMLAVLSIATLCVFDSYREHGREWTVLEAQLRMETRLLAEHARFSIAAADVVLTEIEATIGRIGLAGLGNDRVYWESIRGMIERTPQLNVLVAADAAGRLVFSTAAFPLTESFDLSDREYFRAHLQGEKHFVGKPIIGRSSGFPLIPVSVRLNHPGGEFKGVLVSALDMTHFQSPNTGAPDQIELHIGVYRGDGVESSSPPELDGWKMAASLSSTAAVDSGNEEGVISNVEDSLTGMKIVVRHQVEGYPIIASASYDYQLFLRSLYPVWMLNGLVFLVFAVCITLSIFFISRSMRAVDSERANQLALAQKQRDTERLSRAIIGHLPNGGVSVFDQDLRYVFADGQAFAGEAEFTRAIIPGKTFEEAHSSPSIRHKFESLARKTLMGMECEAVIARQGRIYKVIAVPLENDEGEIRSGLMLTQDITDLKFAHRELEKRNRELQELSLTDALLGIANRRAFDSEIKREWGRAERMHRSLSLLMVDVDCFKPYNDAYGHTRGDACLQQIARILEQSVSRPADLVARYGGEEFAVLLPECGLAGARNVAERIHARLAETAIPFPASAVAEYVTVSIGIAVARPSQTLSPVGLIEEADAALYKAKDNGRNRTEIAKR